MTRLEKTIAEITAGSYRNYQLGDLDDYRQHIHNLNAVQHPYVTKTYGSSATIYTTNLSGKKIGYVYFEGIMGQGYHICGLVKKDIEIWIEKNKDFDYKKYKDPNYKEQVFNIQKIEKNIGKPMIGIDINGCYFDTMFKLKYITQKTYDMAHKKLDEWKTGRNSSVGMLAKEVVYTLYDFKDGIKRVVETIKVSEGPKQAIRHHIIGFVWKTFQELFKELDDDFYMFLTDCIYVDPKHLNKVTKFFEKKGYGSKYKPFMLTKLDKLDENRNKVTWWDEAKPKEKNKEGEVIKWGDFKWYTCIDKQIYKPKKKNN